MITPDSSWRLTANTTPAAFRAELAGSPVAAEADALCDAADPYGRLYLAHSKVENQHDTVGILITPDMRNNLALRPRGYPEERGQRNGFAVFDAYAGCLAAWRRRLSDTRLCYLDAVTMLEYSTCYNPSTDVHPITGERNDPARYCDRLLATINRLPEEGATVPEFTTEIPGLSKPITTSFPVRVALMPPTQTNQRPGRPFNGGAWDFYTQHETANTAKGANVKMHEQWLRSGAGGQQLGFHLCVDDTEAAVFVPLDEIAWHAGDSGGPGNFDSIACELCVNQDGDQAKARTNAEELAAAVLAARGFGTDRLVPHQKWSGKFCPAQMLREGYWPTFVANVGKRLQAPSGGDYPTGMDADLAARWFGSITVDGKVYAYTEGQPLSSLWLQTGRATGHYPQLVGVETFDTRTYWTFEGGWTAWRPNANEPVRVLKD